MLAMTDVIKAFAGIDWASEAHQVGLVDPAGTILGERAVVHGGAGLSELCEWLVATAPAEPGEIAVAIEVSHGPIVETLLERGFLVFSLNPKQLDRFRDRHTVAGTKDDRLDADVAGDALRTDRHCFRRLNPTDPVLIERREWSRMAEDLQQEYRRLANRLRHQLWRYYPQFLALGDDLTKAWQLELWELAPTPARAQQVRRSTVAAVLKRPRIRRLDAEAVLALLRQTPVIVAPGPAEAAQAHIRLLIARLRLIDRQLAEAQTRIAGLCERWGVSDAEKEGEPGPCPEPRDVAILRSCQGSEGSSSPRGSQKPASPCASEMTKPCAACPVSRR
jgi:hypothetical protein